jgi:hypothetical protein
MKTLSAPVDFRMAARYGAAARIVMTVAWRLFAHALRHPFRPARVCRLTGRVMG